MAKYHEYIREAVAKGCWFDFNTNEFVSHTGKRKPLKIYGCQRYPSTAILRKKHFPLHKFVAYLLYGEDAFSTNLEVRHLNGNTLDLSKDNIVLGTSSENQLDKNCSDRSRAASIARNSQGRPTNSKLTEECVREIREYYKSNKIGKKVKSGLLIELSLKYDVSIQCIQSVVYNRLWKDL